MAETVCGLAAARQDHHFPYGRSNLYVDDFLGAGIMEGQEAKTAAKIRSLYIARKTYSGVDIGWDLSVTCICVRTKMPVQNATLHYQFRYG